MVRTKADSCGVKAAGAKAPRKTVVSTPTRSVSDSGDSKSKGHVGGNSYQPRETPGWQKPITTFFGGPAPASAPKSTVDSESAKGSSNSSPDVDS